MDDSPAPTAGRPVGPAARGQAFHPGSLAAVRSVLGQAGILVVTDPDAVAGHAVDWTGHWRGPVLGMVRPDSTRQVAEVLRVARAHRVPVQVQGGNTGLVGGSVPDRPSLLLATTALTRLDDVDLGERTVRVGAGVTVAQLARRAAGAGLRFGVDLASRDSATLGGLAATNAGGISVCAYGMMREQVRGLTAVLADGRVISSIGRPRKDNTGYDLTGLLVGSEGTLGVITEVEVVLHPAPAASSVGLLAVPDLAAAVRASRAVQAAPGSRLLAAEVVDSPGVAQASAVLGLPDPLGGAAPWLLLLEVADGATGEGLAPVADGVIAVATDAADRARLWSYRERQTEVHASPAPDKLDIALRLCDLDAGVAVIRALVAAAGGPATVGFFGHALDGNLHVQLLHAPPDLVGQVLAEVADRGGAISAEHGIGRLKAGHLHLSRSAEEIGWMRRIRAGADPDGLLNPGVLLDN